MCELVMWFVLMLCPADGQVALHSVRVATVEHKTGIIVRGTVRPWGKARRNLTPGGRP